MTQIIEDEVGIKLRPGENLLWSGKSCRGFLFHPASILLIASMLFIAGLVCGLMALNNMTHAIKVIEIVTAALRQRFIVIGLLSGLGILLGIIAIWGFVFYPLQRRKTVYALTNQRAVVIAGLLGKKTTNFELSSINFVALTRCTGAKATVIFGRYPDEYANMEVDQERKVIGVWKWFGYKFDLYEIVRSSGDQSQISNRPRFGRFEFIYDSKNVYDALRKAADFERLEAVAETGGPQLRAKTLVEEVIKSSGTITFVIDASGSMDGDKLQQVKRGLSGALNMVANNRVGLIVFDNAVRTRVPVARLAQNRRDLEAVIRGINATASTALYDALKEGIGMTEMAESGEIGIRAVVVLTDGQANAGKTRLDDIIRLTDRNGTAIRYSGLNDDDPTDADGRRYKIADIIGNGPVINIQQPVQVFFIGIGNDANMEIGRMLAEATSAESQKYIEVQSGMKIETVRRVREVDIARVLEEFKYF